LSPDFSIFRKKLDSELGSNMIQARDFVIKRQNTQAYRLCDKCPQPPSNEARYVINCSEHKAS
jgi:hypothetical protein